MELSRKEIYAKTRNTIKQLNNRQIIRILEEIKYIYLKFLFFLNWDIDKVTKSVKEDHNPMIWEACHPVFFMEKHCLRYIDPNHSYPMDTRFNNNIYDSYVIPSEERFKQIMATKTHADTGARERATLAGGCFWCCTTLRCAPFINHV